MPEYETIATEEIQYGNNKFLELSRKKVLPDGNEFLNISKGYYDAQGSKKYQRGVGFPDEEDLVRTLMEKLQALLDTKPVQEEVTEEAEAVTEEEPKEAEIEEEPKETETEEETIEEVAEEEPKEAEIEEEVTEKGSKKKK